jgi:hypothetical protein
MLPVFWIRADSNGVRPMAKHEVLHRGCGVRMEANGFDHDGLRLSDVEFVRSYAVTGACLVPTPAARAMTITSRLSRCRIFSTTRPVSAPTRSILLAKIRVGTPSRFRLPVKASHSRRKHRTAIGHLYPPDSAFVRFIEETI